MNVQEYGAAAFAEPEIKSTDQAVHPPKRPQHAEVPPNIEAKRIYSYFPEILFGQP